MLLTLKASMMPKLLIFALLNLCIGMANADQAINADLQIHGFIAQGIIDVDGSDFVNDDGELSSELTEVGLNASYQFNSLFRVTGQVVYLDGGNRYDDGMRIDYALLDWSTYQNENWQINLYLGRFKNNHWLYSGTRDVPFTRPSIILPQSIYFDGFRDIAVGGDGVALKVSYSSDHLGDFDFNLSKGSSHISDEQMKIILGETATGKFKQTYDVQASGYWQPLYSSWRFGLSLLDSDFSYEANEASDFYIDSDITLQAYTLNAIYEGEKWEFAVELFQERFILNGLYPLGKPFHQDQFNQGYYGQTRYKMNEDLSFLFRYERFYADKDDKDGSDLEEGTGGLIPSYFGYQHDIVLGLSYDLAEKFRVQFEYHNFEGTSRLTPVVFPNILLNNSKNWDLWAIQLMYWF